MEPEERFERIERQLEFLAASQAQHDARMAEISRIQEENAGQIAGNAAQIASNAAQIASNAAQIAGNTAQIAGNSAQIADNSAQIADNSAQIGQLVDLALRVGRVVEEQAYRIGDLTEAQRRTDERLSTLIGVVERYFTDSP